MDARSIVAIILASCVVIFMVAFPVLRALLPPEMVPSPEILAMYREVVGAIIGALSVWLGIQVGKDDR